MNNHTNRTYAEKLALARDLVDYLNSVMKFDAKALHRLVEHRVPINDALSNADISLVVSAGSEGTDVLGLLGVLNGFIGVADDGMGYLVGCYNDHGQLLEFIVCGKAPVRP